MTSASEGAPERASAVRELLIEVDRTRGRLRGSLRESLRTAIQDGRLAAGTRLPSSRRLASDLGLSRGVVSDAYDQLVAEGYLLVRPRTAPVVAEVPGVRPVAPEPLGPTWTYDFTATRPDVSLFPRRAFARAADRVLRQSPDAAWDYGDHRGRIELRAAASEYLARVRGVRVDPGRVVVVQGFTQAVDLLVRVLVRQGATTVALES
ncbi:MAG TPA: GntR family transcriptional regulator, partial [Actinopolymorphaceae bacterium]